MALMDLGTLMVVNADHHCTKCAQDKGEDAAYIDGGRYWVVMIETGNIYHVQCARDLGWEPSQTEREALDQCTIGPYE